ncbi:ATP-grasp domain-containing protein [Bacillus sp. Marseille-P3661]|uniref:ATP-grasp domain-containing protein n=1 Tax=Bacillus sp. Marseille-P3661 TaxID=1936234 RepID=UPI000C82101D|nr:ATP-grasp domain-containing protein [Bacillus sp. Marseille-P3661]
MTQYGKQVISPSITLKEIYGPNHVLNPRPSYSGYGWLSKNQISLNSSTGSPFAIAGSMPVVYSNFISTKECFELYRLANLTIPSSIYEYGSAEQYQQLLNTFIKNNQKLIINYVHPPEEIPDYAYWINPQLLAYLNNKMNLQQLVPIAHIPKRETVHPSDLTSFQHSTFPFVIKAGTEQPTGGGHDVIICTSSEDLTIAHKLFSASEFVIVEEYLPILKNYCIQFAKTFDGEIIYLGVTEQITNSNGLYMGNWIEKDLEPPNRVLALGREIMEQACAMGYRGIAGFDIVETEDNRVLAIDLNFRFNGSTAPLLLSNNIFKHSKSSILLFRSWATNLPYSKVMNIYRRAINNGWLIPLYISKPYYHHHNKPVTRLSGIIAGTSKKAIRKKILPKLPRRYRYKKK